MLVEAPYDAAVTHFVEHYGLWVVFVVVFFEVAGLPFIPGETALIAAAVVASQGHGSIVGAIACAIGAAVLGAGAGYAIGRRWGRELLAAWPWFARITRPGVDRSERFFERHGSKAVFLGRFLPVVRATLGWMAGVGRMRVWRFALWNVAGAVAWGCGIGFLAYYGGRAAADAVQHYGLYAVAGIVVVVAAGWFLLHRAKAHAR
jgi:membrane protein DedA with SNARE-associated domain